MESLPVDLKEHASTLVVGLFLTLTAVGGACFRLWRKQEETEKSAIAAALRGLRDEIANFGTRFDATITRIFDKIDTLDRENRARDVRCAALHGKVNGWDGTERRQKPR